MARKPLTEYEKAVRAACRSHVKLQELMTAARAETEADRERIVALNKSRRGRPAQTAKDIALKAHEAYLVAVARVREIEKQDSRPEMSQFDIQSYNDPVINKPRGVGHSGQPKNNEIDDLEALIRRIRKRINAINSGKEISKYLTKKEKISGCEKQIQDAEAQVRELEALLTPPESAYQQIKRARQTRREARAEYKKQCMLCALHGKSEKFFDENGVVNAELLSAKNNLNEAESKVEILESAYKKEFGEFKNSECGADNLSRRLRKNTLAVQHAEALMVERKAQRHPKQRTTSIRNLDKGDEKTGQRFRKRND
ncbi:hypothetical protein EDB38_109103 [Vibrio crassostreae]|uniref:hypothetical protein n=1 Tax=Vibrio crassostreae TaxID=246167 RepID=UPI001043D4D1|nr:hypothetical protein [Vibrio crassostreae]TCT50279.1 hypothetical protein EDB42_108103 [Vibrio crassostreae]TCT75273.1 hypothetical protein EDB41_10855 [Vibrio crassostreae]TCT94302.1 hypothetical protein EDB38_109103 [Vibrio crassostreae]